ncbi:MAG: glycosyltransferase family 4 protein [Anaerolineales bacterium]
MKVLMIAPQPFFEPRGTPISVHQRLQALSKLGIEVDLVTYHLGENVEIPGVTIHRIPNIPFINEVRVGPSLTKLFLDGFVLLKSIGRLLRRRYDVIHSHEEAAFFAMILAAIFRTRHLYDMHSSLPRQLQNFKYLDVWPFPNLFAILERAVLRTADSVITIGEDLTDYVRSVVPGSEIWTIENTPLGLSNDGDHATVDVMRENIKRNGQKVIVYTGSFERYQGLDVLLHAFRRVVKQDPHALLVLVGGTEAQISELKRVASSLNVGSKVRFVGRTSTSEALAHLELADVLISPRIEGTSVPLKVYSYLNARRAIIATNIRAHTLVLNDDIAMLVEPTAEGMAEGLIRLLQHEAHRSLLAQHAMEFAKTNHDPDKYLSRIESIYQSLVSPVSLVDQAVSPSEK